MQRFIKSRGNSSSIFRILWHEHQNIKAWIIRNSITYDSDVNDENQKFLNDIKNENNSSKIYPIQGKDIDLLSDVMFDLVRFLSNRIGRSFTELVCDFIQGKIFS